MDMFNIICGVCSVAGLAVSVFYGALVSGMEGIGKTHICRKLFQEYEQMEGTPFLHIGYVEYNGDMGAACRSA